MRRLLPLVVLLLCTTAASAAPKPLRFAWLANDPNNTYDAAILTGIRSVTGPIHATVDPYYAGFDPATQNAQCQAAVESGGYDALIVIAASPTRIRACVNRARRAGIEVAAVDLPMGRDQTTAQPQIPGEVAASFIPAAAYGRAVTAILPQACAGLAACNILYVAGAESFPLDQYGLDAVRRAAAADPSIHLVAHGEAFYDTATAREVVGGAALDAHPGGINVILAGADQMALGAEQAATERGLTPRITGGGAGTSALEAVRAGRWLATFNTLPETEGRLVTRLLLRYRRGLTDGPVGRNPIRSSGLPVWWTQQTLAEHPTFVGEWPGP